MTFKPVVIEKLDESRTPISPAAATSTRPIAPAWPRRASPRRRTRTIRSSCPRSSRRSRWRPPSAMATTNGSTSSNGCSMQPLRPKRRDHLEECRREAQDRRSQHQAHPRRHARHGQGDRPRREMGLQPRQAGRNYGEVFDRNVGKDSPFKLERGLNDLWTKGGLMYAMPVR